MTTLIPVAFDRPLALLLILAGIVPWLCDPRRRSLAPYLGIVPTDRLSRWVERGLRLAGTLAIVALSTALAGIHLPGGEKVRITQGAHLVLLLDRSLSMNDAFERTQDGPGISKATAAKQLLNNFAMQRDKDQVGVIAFSTMPMPVLPLTAHPQAVNAAINAIDHPGLARTDIGRALLLALNMLDADYDPTASRAVILVSDGAGVIGREVQDQIRSSLLRQPVQLYWLFLRSPGTPSIYEQPVDRRRDTPQSMPERHLNLFFESLGIPYLAFEAENPEDVAQALEKIDEQEQQPLRVMEAVPRTDLSLWASLIALLCLLILLVAHLSERSFTLIMRSPSGRPHHG